MPPTLFADRPETILRDNPNHSAKRLNHVLLGTRVEVRETNGSWVRVETLGRGPGGWVPESHLAETSPLKIFFVDVGQGDGAIVEAPNGSLLIDGGPNRGFHSFMRHRYKPLIDLGESVHFDAVVVSHPDFDHFHGLTRVLNDPDFTFGRIFHNGIIRYDDDTDAGRPFDLGKLSLQPDGTSILTETFSTLDQAGDLIDEGNLMSSFGSFWTAAWNARADGRLQDARRITVRDETLPGFGSNDKGALRVKVLGPVPTPMSSVVRYVSLPDPHDHPSQTPSSSHTRNGHSLVLKLIYGDHSFLFGGDLNIPAQKHLMAHYPDTDGDVFRVDVAKACHHGSSDFAVDFLKRVRPRVNVFSSGDNKSFDHPTADAVGAAARHTRGNFPLFFSTELGRAVSSSSTHYGLVNVRSNGSILVAAQMKEQHSKADVWDSFTVPWNGKFPDADWRSQRSQQRDLSLRISGACPASSLPRTTSRRGGSHRTASARGCPYPLDPRMDWAKLL